MADAKGRYDEVETYTIRDADGREVRVGAVPEADPGTLRGIHRRRQGDRLDHLAARYLGDATRWWRICEHNDVMQADALDLQADIAIPRRRG